MQTRMHRKADQSPHGHEHQMQAIALCGSHRMEVDGKMSISTIGNNCQLC